MSNESLRKHLILGTAGHVDHGKTALIKALTGIDTDRLKEEKERGLTIDLGFAWLQLPSGTLLGIVDVPGHEKFLKNMLAGATGVDIALLVVAADEGVMPQTIEHVQILELLRTARGVVALTKIDLVEDDWLNLVEHELRRFLSSTFLREASIVRVSAATGDGVGELVQELDRLTQSTPPRRTDGPFRVPVDRVFTVPGFGTVITGTLVTGTVRIGDSVEVMPQGIQSRVRGIQVHGRPQQIAYAGSRVALNLAGVDTAEIERGNVVASVGLLTSTTLVDATVAVLPKSPRPLANQTRVRLHIGTAELIGRAVVLGSDSIKPGETGFVQLRLEKPAAVLQGDKFIVRFYSPPDLLGGGQILVPNAQRHRRMDTAVVERLRQTAHGSPTELILDNLDISQFGVPLDVIVQRTGIEYKQVAEALAKLVGSGKAFEADGRYWSTAAYETIAERIKSVLQAYHESHPIRPTAPREFVRTALGTPIGQKDFQALLEIMACRGEIVLTQHALRLPNHLPKLSDEQEAVVKRIEDAYLSARTNPPTRTKIGHQYGAVGQQLLEMLVEQGVLVKITPEILMHQSVLREIESEITGYLKRHGQATVAQIRNLLGSSRKYVVPLLEYLDSKRITKRIGDLRVLGKEVSQQQ
ncbi:MAG: selenocysteine-specific translation elongation factor [Armatimonadota bacterium]|nr:selenocysteine-specific translation elongation factor [Armatimonadota bacterium]